MTTVNTRPAPPVDHAHVADLDACSAFINTLELDGSAGVPDDHIPTLGEALDWFATRDLAHEDALRAQAGRDPDTWLERVRETRHALREAWDATVEGRPADGAAIAVINETLGHATRPELRPTLAGMAVGHRHELSDPTGEALALLAAPLVDAIADGDTERFRICANDACRWVFEDTSRGGRRRWCDMQSCGNRAKVRRYRSRHKADDGELAPQAAATEPPAG